jgi:signal transduction histidine kinase
VTGTATQSRVLGWLRPQLLVVAALVVFAGELVIVTAWRTAYGAGEITRELLVTAVWGGSAWLAWRLRPDRPMGTLMLLLTVLLAIIGPVGLGLQDHGWLAGIISTLGIGLVPFQTPLGSHVLLAFPSGRLQNRSQQWLVRISYSYASFEAIALLLTTPRHSTQCNGRCAVNFANASDDPTVYTVMTQAAAAGWLPLAAWFTFLILRRYRSQGQRERRILAPSLAATVAVLVTFVYLAIFESLHGGNVFGARPTPGLGAIVALQLALLAVPLCFLLGLLRERLAYTRVSDLMRDLVGGKPDTNDLSNLLARTLGDPTLMLAFPVDNRLLDVRGNPITVPTGSHLTPVGESERPLVLLIHEASLQDEPDLLMAAGSAVRLALDNARLHAEVAAQLAEVRASRARIIAAGYQARRKLERDLHDGAQQRLLAVGLVLQLLRFRLGNAQVTELVQEAETELAQALQELRSLAAGIHPAVLTDQGLLAAIRTLAGRWPVPILIEGEDPGRLSDVIESAAYFCTSEAMTNAIKHARAARISVAIHRMSGVLTIIVTDDGLGGADPTGSGLRGLNDRALALNGQVYITSTAGNGTRIIVELPCE